MPPTTSARRITAGQRYGVPVPPATPGCEPGHRGLPPGFRVTLDRATRRLDRGQVLLGGSPLRILRLSTAGAALLDRWTAGAPLTADPADGALARRLTDGGLAHPCPPRPGPSPPVTVVVPVRDDGRSLSGLLRSLDRSGGLASGPAIAGVVVVDDGSADAPSVRAAIDAAGVPPVTAGVGSARLVRHPTSRGPGAARNTGADTVETELVAFVDADVEVTSDWLGPLVAHFADPSVGAVAPRVTAATAAGTLPTSLLARYDRARSPLDLGDRPASVRPGAPVPYVPSAAVVVRLQALRQAGGFDPSMHVGEDVDLMWRLHRAGWVVRYEPAATVTHAVRPTATAWVRQRYRYGTSAAALAVRHPGALSPLRASRWSAAAWAALATGHPCVATVLAAGTGMALASRLPPVEHRWRLALRLAGTGHLATGAAVATAARREWWPVGLAAALLSRRLRPAVATAALLPPVVRWVRLRPTVPVASWIALHLADDLAYGAGVWAGCLRRRTLAPLLPDLRG